MKLPDLTDASNREQVTVLLDNQQANAVKPDEHLPEDAAKQEDAAADGADASKGVHFSYECI